MAYRFSYVTPESQGISSRRIADFVDTLERNQLSTHDIIIAKGEHIVYEAYWKPFHRDTCHRMYSVSKSIVSLAVGCAVDDGLIALDDPMSKHFAAELEGQPCEHMHRQTVRDMLTMCTAKQGDGWIAARPHDRVRFYFQNKRTESRPGGSFFQYDTTGSFVLGALVERVTKKPLMTYLREKFMDRIGVSTDAHMLTCPGGHAWGDSALLCKATDLLKIARLVMDGGTHEGKQLISRRYIEEAVSKQVDNNPAHRNAYNTQGYGYLIWRTFDDSYFFNGMGCQLAVCVPHKDMILIYNGDNQGYDDRAKALIIGEFFRLVRETSDAPLPADPAGVALLGREHELMAAVGEPSSIWQERINGKRFVLNSNPMGITAFSLTFGETECRFDYQNAQGDKTIYFLMGRNVYGIFPQEGYADEVGTVPTENVYYRCAASAAWVTNELHLKVQIIDRYLGRLLIRFTFENDGRVILQMSKTAEGFLQEYGGRADGILDVNA